MKKIIFCILKERRSDPELDPNPGPDPLLLEVQIRGSESAQKCHGTPTLVSLVFALVMYPPFVSRKAKIMAQMSAMQKNFAAGHKTLLEGMKVCVMHWFSCGSHAKGCSV